MKGLLPWKPNSCQQQTVIWVEECRWTLRVEEGTFRLQKGVETREDQKEMFGNENLSQTIKKVQTIQGFLLILLGFNLCIVPQLSFTLEPASALDWSEPGDGKGRRVSLSRPQWLDCWLLSSRSGSQYFIYSSPFISCPNPKRWQ